jgi:hypothetical protein
MMRSNTWSIHNWKGLRLGALAACLWLAGCGGGGGAAGGDPLQPPGSSAKAWQSAQPIETINGGRAEEPTVAMNANGQGIALWRQDDGVEISVLAGHYSSGQGWSAPELVETGDGTAFNPSVGIDASGRALAVWAQSEGARSVIKASVHTSQGWSLPDVVSTDPVGSAGAPKIAVAADGKAMVVWTQSQGLNTNSRVWANRYLPGLGWQGAQLMGNSTGAGAAQFPTLALSSNEQAIAVWEQTQSLAGGNTRVDLYTNRFDGKQWGTAELLEADNQGRAVRPDLVIDAQGNAHAAWLQATDNTVTGVFQIKSRRFSPTEGWGSVERVDALSGSTNEPSLSLDAQGNAMLVWTQAEENAFPPTRRVLFASRSSAAPAWSAPTSLVSGTATFMGSAQVRMNALGQAVAVWEQKDSATPSGNSETSLYASRFTPGQGWANAEPIEANTVGTASNPQLAIDAQGNALALWRQFSGSFTDPNVRIDIWANVLR